MLRLIALALAGLVTGFSLVLALGPHPRAVEPDIYPRSARFPKPEYTPNQCCIKKGDSICHPC